MKADRSTLILATAVALALVASATVTAPAYAGLLCYAAALGIFALSVNLVFGTLGYVTFGHAAFLGLGGYTSALLVTKLGWGFWWTLPVAVLPGVLLGAIIGLATVRLGGAYFAIATLTVAEILRLVALNWVDLTRGPLGIVVSPGPLPGQSWHGAGERAGYLFVALLLLVAVVFVLQRLAASPVGRAWTAIRQSLPLAESLGIPTLRFRIANVALSGGLAALAGALLVPKILVVSPDLFGPAYSAMGLLAVILGGRGTLFGPIIGAILFAVMPEWLRFLGDYRFAAFALLLLIVVRALPGGAVSLFKRTRPIAAVAPTTAAAPDAMPEPTPAPAGAVLLEARGIGKSFRGLRAVNDASVVVHRQEIVGLIGPNGAGKTTCLNLLSGFAEADQGSIAFEGRPILRGVASHELARRGLVRTFQQTTLFGQLSVLDNARIATHLVSGESVPASILRTGSFEAREASRVSAARAVLARVGLADRAEVEAGSLAYGEQRMLAIALALAASPKVLLLDEPAAGLNPTEAARLASLLQSLRDEGLGILIIDHNLKMMMSLCDRVVVLHHGEKIAQGAPAQVCADAQVIAAYLGGVPGKSHAAAV